MTREVQIGGLKIGGGNKIAIQSMTNTDTRNAESTAEQILALEQAGCQIVRSSIYDMDCAKALSKIKGKIHLPLVADVHFDHRLALAAIENGADKLRFNPGNIGSVDKVKQLVSCAKAHRVPIRIGVNAGSLDKTLQKLPTAQAMVQSALQHIAILEDQGFYDIVVSMKASSVPVTIEAYKKLSTMVDYPLHIGITEAGAGQIAQIKSAVGIGALLLMGIGDTFRVSITGDPVQEVVAAKQILMALDMDCNDVELISCPTCGRTRVNLEQAVQFVNDNVHHNCGHLKLAIMGCAVNGPGEARDADIGIAFGDGNGVLFEKGERLAYGPAQDMLNMLVQRANARLMGD